MNRIVIVVVEYNGYADVVRLLESADRLHGKQELNVIVVSNTVSEESRILLNNLKSKYSYASFYHNPANSGYLGGINYGIGHALESSPEWIVCCNADIVFIDPNFIRNLSEVDVPSDVMALAPMILTRNGHNQNPFWENRFTKIRWLFYRVYYCNYFIYVLISLCNALRHRLKGGRGVRIVSPLYEKAKTIYAPHGACFILNRKYFKFYPFMDEAVFLWTEELVLAETIRNVKGSVWYAPELKVLHNDSGIAMRSFGSFSKKSYRAGKKAYDHMTQKYFRASPLV
jgi:GT2 family glycosyltransferase